MAGTPKLYVDFNLQDPQHPDRVFASIHRLGDMRLGESVRVTDYEELEFDATIVGLDHLRGLIVLQTSQHLPVASRPFGPMSALFAISGETQDESLPVERLELSGTPI
jgi:hypothetical protein